MMKVLNLFAGIGGNRKLWQDVEVTAVEYNPEIAALYQEFHPNDTVVVGDAHQYLLDHYKEFDFIWASPPCQSHSDMKRMGIQAGMHKAQFIDTTLWQEIIFLKHFAPCRYVVENVVPYYDPFVKPTIIMQRHMFWSNFNIKPFALADTDFNIRKTNQKLYGFDLTNHRIKHRKAQILRNLVNPDLGLYILEQARGIIRELSVTSQTLFT